MSEIVDNNDELDDNAVDNVLDSDGVDTENQADVDGEDNNFQHEKHSDYKVSDGKGADVYHLSGMFRTWFLEYASYVNLERAIPHINDGLKPVQRRVLYSMRRIEDGRYNKVANIVGHTMQFHPHGDASIGEALVNLGQRNLLIDTQGNWGNILTGDSAAAPRYIEARLTKFALDAVFNPKTTEWKPSYDGRNKEPISLPVKFRSSLLKVQKESAWVLIPKYYLTISESCATLLLLFSVTRISHFSPISLPVVCSM